MKLLPFLSVWETEGGWSFKAWTPGWALAMASHTHQQSLTHTNWSCSDSDTWKLHLCHVRAQTPQKSDRDAQLQQQHPLLFRFLLGCTCLPFPSVDSSESQPSRSPFSLLSCSYFSYSSLLSSASLLLVVSSSFSCWCCISYRETDWNRCLRGRQDMCLCERARECVSVCLCVCACTASTNWLICDMRTTAASYRWGRDKRGTSDRERQRKKEESGREMKREEGRGKRERIMCWWEKRERVGDLVEGESNQLRILV